MRDRRLGIRISLPLMMTSYVHDRPVRLLCADLSDSGMGVSSVAMRAPTPGSGVGIELDLPGIDEQLWIAGQICHQKVGDLTAGLGIRFIAMATAHARLLRDYCVESRRGHLAQLLTRIRSADPRTITGRSATAAL
jgi:c-di-GMP-binding flagellar brake protein YcgR